MVDLNAFEVLAYNNRVDKNLAGDCGETSRAICSTLCALSAPCVESREAHGCLKLCLLGYEPNYITNKI